MPYITECKAPDISALGPTLLSRTISDLVFQGRKHPGSVAASRLLSAYLMVTDKAVREYSAGREALIAYATSANNTGLFVEGLGRLETCIHSAKRAFRLLDKMTHDKESPAIDRTLRKLNKSWENILTPIRNTIEHIDEEISAKTALPAGMAHLLVLNHAGDKLEISTHVLALADLATAVRRLYQAGCELVASLPLVSQAVGPRA